MLKRTIATLPLNQFEIVLQLPQVKYILQETTPPFCNRCKQFLVDLSCHSNKYNKECPFFAEDIKVKKNKNKY